MADESGQTPSGGMEERSTPAAEASYSLSQFLLAPLDAIFKAQLHAARSFLNLLLQLGYPHQPLDANGRPMDRPDVPGIEGKLPYALEFYRRIQRNGRNEYERISVPALALVPVAPLGVESAEFKFEMEVREFDEHKQIQQSEHSALKTETRENPQKRPWFLVRDPISIHGTLSPVTPPNATSLTQKRSIQIHVTVNRLPAPSGLEKMLAALTCAHFERVDDGTGSSTSTETLPPSPPEVEDEDRPDTQND